MRIALVIPTLDQSGAEKQLALLAAGLPAAGHEPHVFALDRGGAYERELTEAGVATTIVGKRGKLDRAAMRRLRGGLTAFRPDVLHTWLFAAHGYGWAAARPMLSEHGLRWVQSLRCVDSWKSGWQRMVDRRLWPHVGRFVANGEAVADHYAGAGVDRGRIVVIPNGVRPPETPSEPDLLTRHQLPPDAKIVLIVGRLAPQKRLKNLLWAFQLLRQVDPAARLVVVGDGPQRAELKEYARAVECGPDVRFVGHADPGPWLAAASVFWLGSSFEGQSNALMEAMAVGLPCVASNIDPNRELISHGVEGYLPGVDDAMAFAQYTTRLLSDADERRRLGTAAANRMQTQFGVDTMVRSYAALYGDVLAGR